MGSVHNDLSSWAAKARERGNAKIYISTDVADNASAIIVGQANKIEELENALRQGWRRIRWYHHLLPWKLRQMRAANRAYVRDNSFQAYLKKTRSV